MSEHTKEPWGFVRIDASADDWRACEIWPADRDGDPIATFVCNEIDARRIVACVNACAGIDNEYLESPDNLATYARRMAIQRDELLAAAKNLRDVKGRYNTEIAMKRLIETIAKVESEK